MSLSRSYDFEAWMTVRYASEREAKLDMDAIVAKQEKLKAMARRLAEYAAPE